MSQFTDSQRKIFMVAGIMDIIAAIVILGIKIGSGDSSFPLAIPILLLVPGIILTFIAVKK